MVRAATAAPIRHLRHPPATSTLPTPSIRLPFKAPTISTTANRVPSRASAAVHIYSAITGTREPSPSTSFSKRYQQRSRFSTTATRPADEARIVEVGPRDGLQNEKSMVVPLATKLELIRRLARTGVRDIEAGSFVSPKWVPQMANSHEIMADILRQPPEAPHHINYNFLVPNLKGFHNFAKASDSNATSGSASQQDRITEHEQASPAQNTSSQDPNAIPSTPTSNIGGAEKRDQGHPAANTSTQDPNEMPSNPTAAGTGSSTAQPPSAPFATEISIFAAATDAFSKANTNCTVAESLERFKPIIAAAKERDIRVRGYVSVALGCPFEGPEVDPSKVADLTADLLSLGVDEVSVADTTGMGTVPRTERLLKTLAAAGIQPQDIALHLHDTYGMALPNTLVGLEHGIRIFDSSVAGLGGCPYAPGAGGNVSTEDLVYLLNSLGVHTGIDLAEMSEIGHWISREVGRTNEARAGKAMLAKMKTQSR